jgi:Zn-dependent peptidase ImmA (M78 family)
MYDHPVTSVIRILEHFGIYVIEIGTNARIDACAGLLGNSRIVVLNESLPNDRIRLTALHELAHHLYRDCINGPGLLSEDVEKRAFEFASHMLLPETQLERAMRLKSMVHLVQYKERFGISLAAMIYRARKSKLIPTNLYKRLWRDFGRLGFRKNEPGHVAADRPLRMEALLDAAVSDGKINFVTVAKLAGTDESIVKERVFRAIGGREQEPRVIDFEAYNRKINNN